MKPSLYELSSTYLQALDFLTDPDNAIDAQTISDTMEGLDDQIETKMLNVGRFITMLEYQAEGIAEAEKRQRDRRKTLENKAAALRDYLQGCMTQTGKAKLSDSEIALSLAKLPPSVVVDDESKIPAEFWREKVEYSIDKTAIKAAGGCPGAHVESLGFRVSIK